MRFTDNGSLSASFFYSYTRLLVSFIPEVDVPVLHSMFTGWTQDEDSPKLKQFMLQENLYCLAEVLQS